MTEYGLVPMILVGAVAATVMYTIYFSTNRRPWKGIAVEEALALGAVIVDVRTPEEYATGAIAGAVNLPIDTLPARLGELDRDRTVIVYCASGMRSARATKILEGAGIRVVDAGTMRAFADHLRPS